MMTIALCAAANRDVPGNTSLYRVVRLGFTVNPIQPMALVFDMPTLENRPVAADAASR